MNPLEVSIIVPQALVQNIGEYLSNHPWRDVNPIMVALSQCQTQTIASGDNPESEAEPESNGEETNE